MECLNDELFFVDRQPFKNKKVGKKGKENSGQDARRSFLRQVQVIDKVIAMG